MFLRSSIEFSVYILITKPLYNLQDIPQLCALKSDEPRCPHSNCGGLLWFSEIANERENFNFKISVS